MLNKDVITPVQNNTHRLQTNRGYKKTNRNTDFLLMIFVSYTAEYGYSKKVFVFV